MDSSTTAGAVSGRRAGLPLALVSALAFGGSGVAAKPLIEAGLDPLHVVWLRATGAALVMSPLLWRHRHVPRRRPALLLGFGLLGVAGVQACYFAAVARIPVGVALLVEYLGPALLLGWVRFVQRRPVSGRAAVGVVLALTGLAGVVEVWHGLSFDPLGLLFGLGAAVCQVGYFVLAAHAGDGDDAVDPLAVIAYGLLVGALTLTAVVRPWGMHWRVLTHQVALGDHDVPALLLVAWIVLVATVVAYLTGVISVRRLSPQVAGVVACLEAVVAIVLAWILLGEHLSMPQLCGGALVLVGAFIAQTTASAKPAAPGPVAGGRAHGTRSPRDELTDRAGTAT
jgi:drug/metabolite transporter (DMT)-like permease